MLGLRSLLVEVVSRSVLTSNDLLSTFAERYNLPDPTRPGGLERWQTGMKDGNSLPDSAVKPPSRTISVSPIAPTFINAFDNSINALGGASTAEASHGEMRQLAHIAERMCGLRGLTPLTIKDRKWRLRSYASCWVGRECVEWMLMHGFADSVRQAVVIGTRLMRHHIVSKVSSDTIGIFHNATLFYKFSHADYAWPLTSTTSEPNDAKLWALIDAEYQRMQLKVDLPRILAELITANLARQQKLSISTGHTAVSTSVQGGAPTTIVGGTTVTAATNGTLSSAVAAAAASSSSSSASTSHSLPRLHSQSGDSSLPPPPLSPTQQPLNSSRSYSDLPLALRRTAHFQGEELIRHLKRQRVVTCTRDAVILATYLLLMPKHAPHLLPRHTEAYFYVVGPDGQLPPHVVQSVERMAWQEAQREREAAQQAQQQQQQQQQPNTPGQVASQPPLAHDTHTQPATRSGSPSPDPSHSADGVSPPNDMISAPRKQPLSPTSPSRSVHNDTAAAASGEVLLPSKEFSPPSPDATRGPLITPQSYHAILRECAATLPVELVATFKNADIWYRLALPLTPTGSAPPAATPTLQLPGVVPLTPSPLGPMAHPTVPALGLGALSVDAMIDTTSLPSLVRNHYVSAAKSAATPLTAAAAAAAAFPAMTTDLQEWNWEFVQSFGDDSSNYDFDDADDLVTAVEFNPTGEYLAIGDKAGRVSIVQESVSDKSSGGPNSAPLEYKFYTEFQSHDTEFDCLKSVEIEPKINVIEWWRHTANHMMLLTSNDKTIKLWRLGHKTTNRQSMDSFVRGAADESDRGVADDPNGADEDQASIGATRKQCYKNAHGYNIHSVSVNSDGSSFFSADDLRINLWNVDREDECYTIVDLKPPALTEVDELITVARFHPRDCATLMHGSSKGFIRLADLRQRALVDRNAIATFSVTSETKKTYFSEITDSILDAKFSEDGRYILSRDYMTLRLWDTHNTSAPVHQTQVHPYLQSQLITLLDNESIFDQFQCAMSRDGLHFVSGTYSNSFTLHNVLSHRTLTIKARDDAREPLIINQHYNYDNGAVGFEKPTLAGRQMWRSNAANPTSHPLNNIHLTGTAGDQHRLDLAGGGADPPPIESPNPAQHFNQLKPQKSPNYRKKVLKVAWHPRMNAVAVAGLYKLYLYQAKMPTL